MNNCGKEEEPLDDDGCELGLTGISPTDDEIGSDVADAEACAILPCAGAIGVDVCTSVAGVASTASVARHGERGEHDECTHESGRVDCRLVYTQGLVQQRQ
ncbi:hypothetical protein Dimus_018574 [Dionaea muscipula]